MVADTSDQSYHLTKQKSHCTLIEEEKPAVIDHNNKMKGRTTIGDERQSIPSKHGELSNQCCFNAGPAPWRWPSIETTLGELLVFVEVCAHSIN